jgi:hypothetical protein
MQCYQAQAEVLNALISLLMLPSATSFVYYSREKNKKLEGFCELDTVKPCIISWMMTKFNTGHRKLKHENHLWVLLARGFVT